jgi:hypothetical protein
LLPQSQQKPVVEVYEICQAANSNEIKVLARALSTTSLGIFAPYTFLVVLPVLAK